MKISSVYILILVLVGCNNKEPEVELPQAPTITFVNLEYITGQNVTSAIQLRFKYQDVNSDLGFTYNSSYVSPWVFPKDEHDQFILLGSSDTLPEYNCYDWKIGADIESWEDRDIFGLDPEDTVLSEPNPHFYNFQIDFYSVENGTENRIDLTSSCNPGYDSRLYDFNEASRTMNFEYFPRNEYSGEIVCQFPGMGWSILAGGNPVKAYFYITDNAFNNSNIEETTNLLIE